MISKIMKIHGSSSKITFECEDARIHASGEFLTKDGILSGFVVSCASMKFENGTWLTEDEKEQLILNYHEYQKQPHIRKDWILEFE